MIVDLFAGPGGWDEGLRLLGRRDVIGIECDKDACLTATNAGHRRVVGDVSALRPRDYIGAEGVIASPPCQGFSSAGKKAGRGDIDRITDLLECIAAGDDHRAEYLFEWEDHKSALMVEPMRWLRETEADWLVMEQVPAVMPIWEEYAAHVSGWGWYVDCGVLNASNYLVPQDRERAIFMAHRRKPVHLPTGEREPKRGAVDVLGVGHLGFPRLNDRDDDNGKYRARDMRPTDLPSFTVTEKARSWTFVPGFSEPRQITESEAGRLQSFPRNYPWTGDSRSSRFQQIGNAIPPLMACAVLEQIVTAAERVA